MSGRMFLSSCQGTIFRRKLPREIPAWPFNRGGRPAAFSSSSTAEQITEGIDATGLTAIVTGGSSGIGAETVRVLALRGAQVIMAVRNVSAGNKLKESITDTNSSARIDVLELELSSMASVKNFASQFSSMNLPLNILINNAGVMATPFSLSPDGIELQFATNYIGHFLLTHMLLDKMKSTASSCSTEGRIVTVASSAHKFTYSEGIRFDRINEKSGYQTWRAYGQSKLSSILHTFELSRRLQEEGANVTINSLHPGVVYTNLSRHSGISTVFQNTLGKLLMKNVQEGAATSCYVALHPEVKEVTGKYFCDCKESKPSARATDADLAKKLWDFSMNAISPWI